MALSDPQSITISGSTTSLPRITDVDNTGTYQSADGSLKLTVISAKTAAGRLRGVVRIDKTVIAADPLTAINQSYSGSIYQTFDFPINGFVTADKIAMFTGLNTQLTASTNAVLTKVLEMQH